MFKSVEIVPQPKRMTLTRHCLLVLLYAETDNQCLFQQLVDEENLLVCLGWYEKEPMAKLFYDGLFAAVKVPRNIPLSERLRALDDTGYTEIETTDKAMKNLEGLLMVLIRNGGWKGSTLQSTPATKLSPLTIATTTQRTDSDASSDQSRNDTATTDSSPSESTASQG